MFMGGILLWSLFWKSLALWHSARRGKEVWFVVLAVVNSIGILDMIYLFGVANIKPENLFSKKV
jgi:methionyl-tRNA synthetase